MTTHSAAFVRLYRPADRDALYDICVRTGHEGGDSREVYPDLELLPSIFAAPYAELEPDLTFVLDDGTGRAVGYVLGTADTVRFVEDFRNTWLPKLAERYPAPDGPSSDSPDSSPDSAADSSGDSAARPPDDPSAFMVSLLHTPERMVLPELVGFPAHLHIDLLPDWQGRGYGRALMRAFLDALQAKGVQAVHLSMATANTPARAFYDRLGFREIPVPDPGPVTYLGRSTA